MEQSRGRGSPPEPPPLSPHEDTARERLRERPRERARCGPHVLTSFRCVVPSVFKSCAREAGSFGFHSISMAPALSWARPPLGTFYLYGCGVLGQATSGYFLSLWVLHCFGPARLWVNSIFIPPVFSWATPPPSTFSLYGSCVALTKVSHTRGWAPFRRCSSGSAAPAVRPLQ